MTPRLLGGGHSMPQKQSNTSQSCSQSYSETLLSAVGGETYDGCQLHPMIWPRWGPRNIRYAVSLSQQSIQRHNQAPMMPESPHDSDTSHGICSLAGAVCDHRPRLEDERSLMNDVTQLFPRTFSRSDDERPSNSYSGHRTIDGEDLAVICGRGSPYMPRIEQDRDGYAAVEVDEDCNITGPTMLRTVDSIEPIQAWAEHEQHVLPQTCPKSDKSIKAEKLQYWNPSWLSTSALLSFCISQAIFATITIILRQWSIRDHGFPVLTTNHYAWTYGPTVILTIVGSIWTQIEYWCKVLQPWRELKNRPGPAQRTLLLDYVSPILPNNLCKAVRFRHLPVFLSLLGGLTLKIVTVASTGLLASGPSQTVYNNIALELDSEFVVDEYLRTGDQNSVLESVIDFEAYALLTEGLPFPDGIQWNLAFQRFKLPADATLNGILSSIEATVDTFQPLNQCEEANVTFGNISTLIGDGLPISPNVSWHSCPSMQPADLSFVPYANSSRKLYGSPGIVQCPPMSASPWGLVTLYDLRYNQSYIPSAAYRYEKNSTTGNWALQIMPPTAVVCNISYLMVRANVTYDLSQTPAAVTVDSINSQSSNNRLLENLTQSIYAQRVLYDADDIADLFGDVESAGIDEPDTFFNILAMLANASTFEDLLGNHSKMAAAAADTFTYIGVQVANTFLITNTSGPLVGRASSISARLLVSSLASWTMFAGFLLLAAAGISLVFVRPKDVSPCRLGTIGGTAFILSQSPEVQGLLGHCGHAEADDIAESIALYNFQSEARCSWNDRFCITPSSNVLREAVRKSPTAGDITWWTPIPLRLWLAIISFTLPIVIITVLEALQRLSSRPEGIIILDSPHSLLATFGTRIVPSAVFICVALLYDAFKFNLVLLTPFARLKKGKAKASESIDENLLGQVAVVSLLSALRHHHWPAALAMFASIIGSFLTIAASGLFVVDSSPGPVSLSVLQVDRFDPSWPNSLTEDGGAAALLPSFAMLNLSYPAWTTLELTIPMLNLSSSTTERISSSSQRSINLILPALRAELECELVQANTTSVGFDALRSTIFIDSSTQTPATCNVSTSSIEWSVAVWLQGGNNWIGQMLDLHPGETPSFGEFEYPGQENSPPGCPSLAFTFGNYSGVDDSPLSPPDFPSPTPPDFSSSRTNFSSSPTDFSIMSCYQLMAQVQTNVSLSVPDFAVISAVPDESSVEYLSSGPDGQTAFSWRPQAELNMKVAIWNGNFDFGGVDAAAMAEYPNDQYSIDAFYALLLSRGTPPEDLWGPQNRERYLDAVQTVYRQYMAQVASLMMRVPLNVTEQASAVKYEATWIDPDRAVLRQNTPSKLLLQIILGTMSACGLAAYLIMDTKKVLPHNPCSIAGMAALLAGSTMCGEALADTRTCNNRSRQRYLWGSWLFSLGWWDKDDGAPQASQRFGIDIGEARRESLMKAD
ncbi:hypothetical protein M406DRAFT_76212 [Cryphonectria parasitica EP155]|uniref:Uncharacterized protein n=1 Tax=Cryphonectria parasitica (strain ATCC 38755 / EP155) TaxID=660469 RepID=A0A9P4XVK6_CRYP1|nr:uncharacterized protein M406DRAFT_76212 [Cryphonectria parasitica EP155]KAF3762097.1 hypothetical protein M406DRAFT_76212 [Cryphonectria parasitica EP155]